MSHEFTYDVRSYLNPRYLETGHYCDYYGIYEVVKIRVKTRRINGKPIVMNNGTPLDNRDRAYALARQLNEQRK